MEWKVLVASIDCLHEFNFASILLPDENPLVLSPSGSLEMKKWNGDERTFC